MKAIKNCFWKYFGIHKFKAGEIESFKLTNGVMAGRYTRECVRCRLVQDITICEGIAFLEREWGGK